MSQRVRKAVIPAAGLGTRFLPATKAQPKEMLPLVDKPAIQYVVEEAVSVGITDILVITGRGKRSLEDHFDRSFELEYYLQEGGKLDELEEMRRIAEMADIHYVRQGEPKGLGHAVLVAAQHVGDLPFVVMLGDDIMHPRAGVLAGMLGTFERYGRSVIALKEVAPEDISSYGCAAVKPLEDNIVQVEDLVEKPAPGEAPSNLAVMGRYVFSSEILDVLAHTKPGRGGEYPAHRRHQGPHRAPASVRLDVPRRSVRRRQQARLPAGDGGARSRTRGPRAAVPQVPRRTPGPRTGLATGLSCPCWAPASSAGPAVRDPAPTAVLGRPMGPEDRLA